MKSFKFRLLKYWRLKHFKTQIIKFIYVSAPPDCEAGKFSCGTYKFNSTYCIPQYYRCDKSVDCLDKSDEAGCDYRNKHEGDHECKPKKGEEDMGSLWIRREKVCDGYFDCRDKSDEESCESGNQSCEVRNIFFLKQFSSDHILNNFPVNLSCVNQ